jgi:Fis family transcriptional regulator
MEITKIDLNSQQEVVVDKQQQKCLRECVLDAMDNYFSSIDESSTIDEKTLVIDEVESAMYEGIMRYTRGNQSKAAKVLGVSRGTLRTKLMHYFSTTHVGGIYRV